MPNVTIRLPKEMYWRLRELSLQQGVPLERYIVSILNSALVSGVTPGQAGCASRHRTAQVEDFQAEADARPVSS